MQSEPHGHDLGNGVGSSPSHEIVHATDMNSGSPPPSSSGPVRFGVIGANSFVANAAVLPAIDASPDCRLVAAASRSGDVPDRWSAVAVADYDAVLTHPDVEAVYIPLPNGMHRAWTERAAAAGKHVLCEKPLAPDADTARKMAAACAASCVLLAEAWMTPFDRRWHMTLQLACDGAIGHIDAQCHSFTFTIGPDAADNYRWDPEQGGGALLDVGIYCVGTAVELWGHECTVRRVRRVVAPSGVDATTYAVLEWPGRRIAEITCSFIDDENQKSVFHGDDAMLLLQRAAFTSGDELDNVIVRSGPQGRLPAVALALHAPPSTLAPSPGAPPSADARRVEQFDVDPGNPYEAMVTAYAAAVRGRSPWPRPVERSIELLDLLDTIRDAPSGEAVR